MGKIPVRFMRAPGEVYSTPPGRPVIQIMMYKTRRQHGEKITWDSEGELWRQDWALVDTGADHSVIDQTFATRLGLRPIQGQTVVSQGVNGSRIEPVYSLRILLTDGVTELTTDAISSPLSDHGTSIPIILGMSLFVQCALRLDFINGIFELETPPKRIE